MQLLPRLRISLAWKFFITLTAVTITVIPLASSLFIRQSLQVLNSEAEEKAKILKQNLTNTGIAITRNVAMTINTAVAGNDFTFVQNIISSTVASDKSIRYAILVDNQGKALVHSDPLQTMKYLRNPQDLTSQGVDHLSTFEYSSNATEIFEVAAPILVGAERWGTLRVGFTEEFLREEINKSNTLRAQGRRNLIYTTLLIAGFSILFVVFLAVLFSRHIVKALHTIIRATQGVSSGDFSQRVAIQTGDELEGLGQAINTMTHNLDILNQEAIQKARMESEFKAAEILQKNLLQQRDPILPQIELASYFRSATETAGDWYAMAHSENSLAVIIADVTGHGLPAAFLAEAAHSCFKTLSQLAPQLSPSQILSTLQKILSPYMSDHYGMTAFVSKIDLETRRITFSNAGHNMPYLCSSQGQISVLDARGPRLGDLPKTTFSEHASNLHPGDMVLWYTDGLTDCTDQKGEPLGKRKIFQLLREHACRSGFFMREVLADEITRFTGGLPPPDDITFIVGKVP